MKSSDDNQYDMAKKRKHKIGVIFWVAVILLVLIIIVLNNAALSTLIARLSGSTVNPDVENNIVIDRTIINDNAAIESADNGGNRNQTTIDDGGQGSTIGNLLTPSENDSAVNDNPTVNGENQTDSIETTIYFTEIIDERAVPKGVIQQVTGDSPLTGALNSMLDGPSGSAGLVNFVPEGSKLLGVSVSEGLAKINFNRPFYSGTNGAQRLIARLRQVIYTATEFSTVNRVQFLVEGQIIQTLGGDGIYIGAPLSRDSF